MTDTAWMTNAQVKCRCGQIGVINGVAGTGDMPENVWVTHRVGLAMETHIHRKPQMTALMAQLRRPKVVDTDPETDAAASA